MIRLIKQEKDINKDRPLVIVS